MYTSSSSPVRLVTARLSVQLLWNCSLACRIVCSQGNILCGCDWIVAACTAVIPVIEHFTTIVSHMDNILDARSNFERYWCKTASYCGTVSITNHSPHASDWVSR